MTSPRPANCHLAQSPLLLRARRPLWPRCAPTPCGPLPPNWQMRLSSIPKGYRNITDGLFGATSFAGFDANGLYRRRSQAKLRSRISAKIRACAVAIKPGRGENAASHFSWLKCRHFAGHSRAAKKYLCYQYFILHRFSCDSVFSSRG